MLQETTKVTSLHPELNLTLEIAQIACKRIKSEYQNPKLQVSLKMKADYVSNLDKELNQAVINILQFRTPTYTIISEEAAPIFGSKDKPTWYVDPLDGTASFIFQTNPAHPSFMMALEHNKEIEMSVVAMPFTDEIFFAVKGHGTYYAKGNLNFGKIFVNPLTNLEDSWVVLNQYGDRKYETPEFKAISNKIRDHAGHVTIESPHSGIGARVLLSNKLGAVIHDNDHDKIKQDIWDRKPIQLLVEEAGGFYCDLTGKPYVHPTQGPILITANKKIKDEIINLHVNNS